MAGRNEEKVLEAAKQVFLRYGYKRVTMADIAAAADMSRPALYLVFPSKEEILIAVTERVFTATIEEIRESLRHSLGFKERLALTFDRWTVRGYELVRASPDAKDLIDSTYEFAAEVTRQGNADFTDLVASILDPLVLRNRKQNLTSVQIAQILVSAMAGFKASAKNTEQLRNLISGLIEVVLAALDEPKEISHKSPLKSKR